MGATNPRTIQSPPIKLIPAKVCVECGGAMHPTYAPMAFTRGDLTIEVENVPVSKCEDCNAQLVPGPAAVWLGDVIEDEFQAHVRRMAEHRALAVRSVIVHAQEMAFAGA